MEATTIGDGANSDAPAHSREPNYGLRIWAGYALSIATTLTMGCVGYFLTQQMILGRNWIEHTHFVIEHLEGLTQAMQEMQIGARDYILTGTESELARFVAGRAKAASELADIQQLTSDNPVQQKWLAILRPALASRIDIMSQEVTARRANDSESAKELVFSSRTLGLTNTILKDIAQMTERERVLLRARTARQVSDFHLMALTIICGSIAAFLFLSLAGVFIYKMLQALRESLRQGEIAERGRLEAARFRTFLEASPEATIISDRRGQIAIVNSRAEELFGYTRAELLGQPIEILLPQQLRGAHLGHREAYYAKPVNRSMGFGRDLVGRRKDGTEVPIEVSLAPVETDLGALVSTVIVDITARKAAERELQRRKAEASELEAQRFKKLLEASPEAIIISDRRGEIAIVNSRAEELFGYTREELLGQPIEGLLPERLRRAHLGHREGYYARPINRSMGAGRDLLGLRKDGTEFPIEVSLGPVETDQGAFVSSVIVDITARKAAERELDERREALARSNEELEQFAYVASHDLQEPLRMVASYVQLLAQRYQGKLDSDADDFIKFAVDGATRMKTLINDLLAYARVGSRGKPLERVELAQVLEQALSNLAMAVSESRAEVTCDRMPAVIGDPDQLAELLQNLIGNAIKFQSNGTPRIHVGAERRDGEWIVSVRDNGIGIDPQFRERIFVIFQRLHGREEYPGTGIGLAICKKIVTRHGGRIWADSEPGQGATFSFTVPAAVGEAWAA